MSSQDAETLGHAIVDGLYAPTALLNCESRLEPDRNPHSVRFKQFALFGSPRFDIRSTEPPEYLIVRQYTDDDPERRRAVSDRVVKLLSDRLAKEIAGSERPAAGGTRPAIAELPQRLTRRLQPFERAGFRVRRRLTGDLSRLPDRIRDVLSPVFLPDRYQSFDTPFPHLALCATFEQVWEPRGYTRGELINTISLAPGEQLTIEVHSWDKRTSRSEEELLNESEMRVVDNLTARDSRTVTREVAKNFSANVGADATIPIKAATVTLSGDVSQSASSTLTSSREQLRERTIEASNNLKTTRKLRIEVSREVGRERKQTHVISNTNRCNTLNCHFFEVTANYLVTTRLLSVQPCVLLPGTTAEVTPEWVLAHEALLKEVLLGEEYLGGIEGARVLATHETFKEVRQEATDEEFGRYVTAIRDAFRALQDAVVAVENAAADPALAEADAVADAQGQAATLAALTTEEQAQRVMYLARLRMNRVAYNALVKLESDATAFDAEDALRNLFAVVRPRAFVPHPTFALGTGLTLLGIDPRLFYGLLGWGYTSLYSDDAGLYNAIKAAHAKLKAFDTAEGSEAPETGHSHLEVARAQVAFEQLKAHIAENWVHYSQAAWLRESADQRFVRMQAYGAIARVLGNEILGFLGHKVAFGISDPAGLASEVNVQSLAQTISVPDEAPRLITVPTQGTILEATLGQCAACDDFIQASRDADLRVQQAKAAQEEAEAERRRLRLQQSPPELDDPVGLRGSGVTVSVQPPPAT